MSTIHKAHILNSRAVRSGAAQSRAAVYVAAYPFPQRSQQDVLQGTIAVLGVALLWMVWAIS